MGTGFSITTCPQTERPAALRYLYDNLGDEKQQAALVATLESIPAEERERSFEGLLVAVSEVDGSLAGAVWVHFTPGRSAAVWPPAANCPAGEHLMRRAAELLDQRQVVLAQCLFSPAMSVNEPMIAAGGFSKLVDLSYLTAERQCLLATEPSTELKFVPGAGEQSDRLGKLLVESYEQTRDCPELNGVRLSADVVAGYRSQGEHFPEGWFFVRDGNDDVGTLLLTKHNQGKTLELVYMGILPAERGKRFGWQTLQFALWRAYAEGAERLVLAVDEKNRYALDLYHRAGFVMWDRRAVYARITRDNPAKS